jgi:alkylhydroperoxidase family enzyme
MPSITSLAPPKVQRAAQALLTRPGACTPELRQAVEAHAAALSGGTARAAPDLPAELVGYVEKVTQHAYQMTDQDVQSLKEAGYSEDAIFEITLCASLGAGLARLERGLLALAGG